MKQIKFAGLLLLLCLQGCLFYPQPKQNTYSLAVSRSSQGRASSRDPAISVSPLQIHPAYANQGFVYRLPGGLTQSDYYNRFLAAPESSITELLKSWLQKSGHFRSVTGFNQSQNADYIVSGTIESLYGDFTDSQSPTAVVAIRIHISPGNGNSASENRKLLGNYEKKIPLARNSPENLMKAWNQALADIFSSIDRDLTAATR